MLRGTPSCCAFADTCRCDALGLQFEKHGVDEVHHIVAAQLMERGHGFRQIGQSSPFARSAREVDVAWVVFPEVAIAHYGDLLAQGPQAFCQGGVYVAVFSNEQYSHASYLIVSSRMRRPSLVLIIFRKATYFLV